jgi:hypothetical protein
MHTHAAVRDTTSIQAADRIWLARARLHAMRATAACVRGTRVGCIAARDGGAAAELGPQNKKQKNTKQIKSSNTRKRRRARVKSVLMSDESAPYCAAQVSPTMPANALRAPPRH